MKKVLLVLMMLLLLTSVGLAEDNTEQGPLMEDAVADAEPVVAVNPAPAMEEVLIMAQPVKATEVSAPAKLALAEDEPVLAKDEPIVPAIIKDLPNMPDVEKITEIAEEEGAPWGTYGGVIVLILAAIVGFIKVRRKKLPEHTGC